MSSVSPMEKPRDQSSEQSQTKVSKTKFKISSKLWLSPHCKLCIPRDDLATSRRRCAKTGGWNLLRGWLLSKAEPRFWVRAD